MKTNEEKSNFFALLATILSIVAFGLYYWKVIGGGTRPNISSWVVWSFLTVLNFISYKSVTGDWMKSLLPTANSVMCIVIAGIALKKGSIGNLNVAESICLGLGILAGIVWWLYKSASYAQILLNLALMIGAIPTIMSVWKNPSNEPWGAWLIWIGTFVAQYFAIKASGKGKRIEFLYPINGIVLHSIIFLLAVR